MRRDIARVVAEAKAADAMLRPGYLAGILAVDHPDAEITVGTIIDELIAEAKRESIPSEKIVRR